MSHSQEPQEPQAEQLSLLSEADYKLALRQGRIEARDRYEEKFFDKGGDRIGIARGTNAIYREIFPQGRPAGKRNDWQTTEQEDILIAEIAARREVEAQKDREPEESQDDINDRLVKASRTGAARTKEFLGWLSR